MSKKSAIAVVLVVVLIVGLAVGIILSQSKKVVTEADQQKVLSLLAPRLSATVTLTAVVDPDAEVVMKIRNELSSGTSTTPLEEITASMTIDDILAGYVYWTSPQHAPKADKDVLTNELKNLKVLSLEEPSSADGNTVLAYLVAQDRLSTLSYNIYVPTVSEVQKYMQTATASTDLETVSSAIGIIKTYNTLVQYYDEVLKKMAKPGDALNKLSASASTTIAELLNQYPPSANTTELQNSLQSEISGKPALAVDIPWLFKAERQYVSTNLSQAGSLNPLLRINMAAKFKADADLAKELQNKKVSIDLSYTDTNSATAFTQLNLEDTVWFIEKIRLDLEALAQKAKGTPVSSVSRDLSLNYISNVEMLTGTSVTSAYGTAMNGLTTTWEAARKWLNILEELGKL
ncbi:hypothetical protein HPY42_06110 [Coprothermobacteraceae bacterium]|nr:hypothetical protein [Coprothermobacteraceae bacterium]